MSILTFAQLSAYRGAVTLVDGSFDPLHPGHLAYFRAARSLGYPLLCNVCPDAETAKKHPVLLPAPDRAQILVSLDVLTYVHVSERPTVEILTQLQPAFYVKGGDWVDRLPTEQGQVCDELGIRIRYTGPPTQSSTMLLDKLQPDVDAFERLVLGQTHASEPWEPTAAVPFDLESRRRIEGRHPVLVKEVFQPTHIVDAGCGPEAAFVQLLGEVGLHAQGFDSRPFPELRYGIWNADLSNGANFIDHVQQYDLVICREVLEHLTVLEIACAVSNLCALSSKFVYVTTRFAKQPAHLLSVDTADDLDPDHRSMLHPDFLRTLFVLEGFKRRIDLEDRMDWQHKGRVLVYERAA